MKRHPNCKRIPLQALLAAVVSADCELHGKSLMAAIKTCYNIYLVTKDPMIIATAKASLDQMLGAVFQRLQSLGVSSSRKQLVEEVC